MTVGTKGAFVTGLHPWRKAGRGVVEGLGEARTDGDYEIMLG